MMDSCRNFPELRSDLLHQAQWRTGLERLPASAYIGFLHINAAPILDSLMPINQQAIEQVNAADLMLGMYQTDEYGACDCQIQLEGLVKHSHCCIRKQFVQML